MTTSSLESGLYASDFGIKSKDEYTDLVRFLEADPSCRIMDNVVNETGLLLVFRVYPTMTPRALEAYSHIAIQSPVYLIPTIEPESSILKAHEEYQGLGGGFNWVKIHCPRRAVGATKEFALGDRRIGPTIWTVNNWLYSRVRIPEPTAAQELRDGFIRVTDGGNAFRYIAVVTPLKNVGIEETPNNGESSSPYNVKSVEKSAKSE